MELKQLKFTQRFIDKLTTAGFESAESLLLHYPVRYEDIQMKPFQTWLKSDKIWIQGTILEPLKISHIRKNLSITKFMLESSEGVFQVTLFNRPWLKAGMVISLYARYEGQSQLTGLQYNTRLLEEQLGIHPVYRLSHGLTQKDIEKAISKALEHLADADLPDIPETFKARYRLLSRRNSIRILHHPDSMEAIKQAKRTLKYEEFLRFQTKLQINRKETFGQAFGKNKVFDRRVIMQWMPNLPFELTLQQEEVLKQILDDLQSDHRMYRLLQGDVGSGKTIVAALAMYATVLAHYQAAFLVPTEILAKQHLVTLKTYLPKEIRIEALYSGLSLNSRRSILERLRNHEIDILIGTHALIQPDVIFRNCGLVVADEQHRFGVEQRRALSEKGEKVDFLLMSATPIPRTLASVLFGDLDVSSITAYHASKQPVKTILISQNSVKTILSDMLRRIEEGDQIYLVAPAIEEDSGLEVKNVTEIAASLRKILPKKISLEVLHGRLSQDEKERVLKGFYSKAVDILVTTTVIEVGVNVPTANTMVIYDSDRFGLSQLHQLRGRVGRGSREGTCYLLSGSEDELTLERLKVLTETTDGFEIANKDLELRGPGEFFGLKQSGIPGFLIANVILDQAILLTAQKDAAEVMSQSSDGGMKTWIAACQKELTTQKLD